MQIDYDVTVEDLVQFNVHHLRASRTMQDMVVRNQVAIAFLTLLSTVMLVASGLSIFAAGIPMALLAGYLVGRLPGRIEGNVRRVVTRTYSEGLNKGTLGHHRVTLTAEGILDENEYVESRTRWAAVERVDASADHIFVYTSSTKAHVIPRRAFADQTAYQRFIDVARSCLPPLPAAAARPLLPGR